MCTFVFLQPILDQSIHWSIINQSVSHTTQINQSITDIQCARLPSTPSGLICSQIMLTYLYFMDPFVPAPKTPLETESFVTIYYNIGQLLIMHWHNFQSQKKRTGLKVYFIHTPAVKLYNTHTSSARQAYCISDFGRRDTQLGVGDEHRLGAAHKLRHHFRGVS